MEPSELQTTTTALFGSRLQALQRIALVMLVMGLVLAGLGFTQPPPAGDGEYTSFDGFFHSYLFGYLFWFGVTAGSLGFLMLHHVVGGGWGFVVRRFIEASTRMLPIAAILFLPIAYAAYTGNDLHMFPWANHTYLTTPGNEELVGPKLGYLNWQFFLIRAALYFAVWIAFGQAMLKWGAKQEQSPDGATTEKLNFFGGLGILIYVLTITFMTVDWVMSLEPKWLSSIAGLLMVASHGLSALATTVFLVSFLAGGTAAARQVPDRFYRDLGNLMLALVMLWGYMSFSQYLITYSGNTSEEVSWYLRRAQHGWGWVSLTLIPLHFFLPFFILAVGTRWKTNLRSLGNISLLIILARLVDLWWWIVPNFRLNIAVTLSDLGAPLLIGGIWLLLWTREIKDKSLVPLREPRFTEHAHEVLAHHA